MTAATFTDAEAGMRTWLRAQNLPEVGTHVYFAMPTGAGVVFPLVTVGLVGGRPQAGEAPLEDVLLVLDCWAKTKEHAADAMRAVKTALRACESVPLDGFTYCHGVTVENTVWLPDPPPSTLKRYSITVSATVAVRELA